MQTLVKCPECGEYTKPYYEPDCDANTICFVCKTKFKWEDYET